MSLVTLHILEGLERGRTYSNLETPLTIGREDDNAVQLNDERISRFHAKIQEDNGHLILTDLESTNGTRVNGVPVEMRILQPGDLLSIGRCLLYFGDPTSYTNASQQLDNSDFITSDATDQTLAVSPGSGNFSSEFPSQAVPDSEIPEESLVLFPHGRPDAPPGLSALQRAQLNDLLAYIHNHLGNVLEKAQESADENEKAMRLPWATWQLLLSLELDLAGYLKQLNNPEE